MSTPTSSTAVNKQTLASPKTNKSKTKKEATDNSEVVTTPMITDRTNESEKIEQELSSRYLGTIKVFPDQVNAKWREEGLVSNRSLDDAAVKKLAAAFEESMDRVNPRHHMVVTIRENDVEKLLNALNMTKEKLKESAAQSEWPLITKDVWRKYGSSSFVLQAGQHRFAALKLCIVDPNQRWWPATIYIESLSLNALDRIRANVTEVHTSLCDGERILHLATYQAKIDEIASNSELRDSNDGKARLKSLTEAMRWKYGEFEKGAVPRVKQLWERVGLRNAISAACEIPGIKQGVSVTSMGDILSLRIMEVCILCVLTDG